MNRVHGKLCRDHGFGDLETTLMTFNPRFFTSLVFTQPHFSSSICLSLKTHIIKDLFPTSKYLNSSLKLFPHLQSGVMIGPMTKVAWKIQCRKGTWHTISISCYCIMIPICIIILQCLVVKGDCP